MNSDNQLPSDYSKPVAYDANGQPLYSHPPKLDINTLEANLQTIETTEPIVTEKVIVDDAIKLKHDRSTQLYPDLNLSEGEYVISAIKRHPIGLFLPLSIGVFLISLSFVVLFNFDLVIQSFQLNGNSTVLSLIIAFIFLFIILILIGTYVFYYVYINNKFYLTNESVIQEIQASLFSRLEQTVSLSNIEDASFTQVGIIQQLFNYGSIRLSTEGDETTYRFPYVSNPKKEIATVNNAVEAFQSNHPQDRISNNK